MIKIEKDLKQIPPSLDDHSGSKTNQTTQKRRNELIESRQYIHEKKYNQRYKLKDIKLALSKIYHSKCAFCEQRIEAWQVEHFRPKSIYYWLAYSWDNLLCICPNCNSAKGNRFEVGQNRIEYYEAHLQNIHALGKEYNELEQPMLFNPEQEDPEPEIRFAFDGSIISDNPRIAYTIQLCKLNRDKLKDWRKEILDDFHRELNEEIVQHPDQDKQQEAIMNLVNKFLKRSRNRNLDFLAFRRYALKNLLQIS